MTTQPRVRKGFVDIVASFVACAKAAELMEPADSSLDDPPMGSQTTTMFGITFRQDWFDALLPQHLAMRLGVVRRDLLALGEDVCVGDLVCRAPAGWPGPKAAIA